MRHFLFEDLVSGEEFIVGACDLSEARSIAIDVNFGEEVRFCYEMTEFEAESSGLDEY